MRRRGVVSFRALRGVFVGEVDFGGVVSFRFVGEEVEAEVAVEVEVDLEGDLGRSKNILFVSGSVRTEMGDVVVGSRSGDAKRVARLRGVEGGVPSNSTLSSAGSGGGGGGRREGEA